ncbi:uncharacterized protein [Temnothorax nylanderi]|uniref:uncharacterized protein isoform X1 n=1 Tax=Temnothorax nylanderi TaxID=102681 RepID=UPI003A893F3C
MLRRENFKPIELVNYGENFWKVAFDIKLPDEELRQVQNRCTDFLVRLTEELTNRLPSCIESIEKLKAFSPNIALGAGGRPEFGNLPLNIIQDSNLDLEAMESQWMKLASFQLSEICPDEDDVEVVDIIKFWSCVWNMKNGAGHHIFQDLAKFVLSALSLPLSNAVVERLFSVLNVIKTKLRNKLQIEMLEALLRVRTHFQVNGVCCSSFEPSKEMIENFNSKQMYIRRQNEAVVAASNNEEEVDGNLNEVPTIAIGLTSEDGDIDGVDIAPVPEWNQMLNLLAELNDMTDMTE